MCFPSNENPFVKICIKISKISVEKDHAGGCFSVSFSDSPESVALGCLFVGGGGLGNEPLLDQELLVPAVIDAILSEPVIPLLPFLQEDPQSAVEPVQAVPLMPSIQEDPKDSVNTVPASVPLLVPPQPGPKPFMEAARLASDQQLVPFRQEALMQFLKVFFAFYMYTSLCVADILKPWSSVVYCGFRVHCEQPLFFFRFSKGSACARER